MINIIMIFSTISIGIFLFTQCRDEHARHLTIAHQCQRLYPDNHLQQEACIEVEIGRK